MIFLTAYIAILSTFAWFLGLAEIVSKPYQDRFEWKMGKMFLYSMAVSAIWAVLIHLINL